MRLGRAMWHWLAAAYWRLACPVKADAAAVIAHALHRAAFETELRR